jgi:ATP:corrinoid adenosyltransferase
MAPCDRLSLMQSTCLGIPEEFNVALLGGRGGGKTVAALNMALQHVQRHGERADVLVVRRTLRALSEFEDEMVDVVAGATAGMYSYNRAEKILRVAGATVTLAAVEDRRSYDKLQGKSFTMLIVEEVTQFASERLLRMLRSNLRAPEGVPTRLVYVGNPGGPLHGLVFKRHVQDRTPYLPYEIELEDGDAETWVTVPSTLLDNPFIDGTQYMRRLREACHGNPALLRQWIEGAWEEGAGLLFPAFDPAVHVLPHPDGYTIDSDTWRPRVAIDWGLSSPSVALLGLRARRPLDLGRGCTVPAGSLWVIQETTDAVMDDETDLSRSREWPPSRLGERVVNRAVGLGVRRPSGVVDSARGLRGEELAVEMRTEGFHDLRKPKKGSRAEGWALVGSMLTAAADRDPVRPHIYFDPSCRYLLATLPSATRDESDPDDWADTPACPDHAGDALRYLINEQRTRPTIQGRFVTN